MNILIEGPDGSGKSTLARVILQHVPELLYKRSSGPPKYKGEMHQRVLEYLSLDNHLFDRHPCVSQLIYDKFRTGGEDIDSSLVDRFYQSKPFIIYCYGRAGEHVANNEDADTPEHLTMIEEHENDIRQAYREWACKHVPVEHWYTAGKQGDRMHFIINLIKENYYA